MTETENVPHVHCSGTGRILEAVQYREPPPGDAVFEKDYAPDPASRLRVVMRERDCVSCGGTGNVPERRKPE